MFYTHRKREKGIGKQGSQLFAVSERKGFENLHLKRSDLKEHSTV